MNQTVEAQAPALAPVPAPAPVEQAAAFQRLYPAEYYAKFLSEGVRPDGRPPGRPRPISIGLGSITTADASALVKVGSATALACIKIQVMVPEESCPKEGQLITSVEVTPMASADIRPGRAGPTTQILCSQVDNILQHAIDSQQLCIAEGKAAWMAYLDIYILDADGSLFDVSLLAAVAALQSLRLPQVALNDEGTVVAVDPQEVKRSQLVPESTSASVATSAPGLRGGKLVLRRVPISLTVGWHGSTCIADLYAAEMKLLTSIATVVLDAEGCLLGFHKVGGTALDSLAQVQDCIAHARLRYKEAALLLASALAAHDADTPTDMEP